MVKGVLSTHSFIIFFGGKKKMNKFLVCITFLVLLPFSVQAGVLTIDTEPPEFIKIKQQYQKQKKASVTPTQYKKLQHNYEKDTEKILQSPTYLRQKNVIETAQAQELQKVEKRYQARLAKLKKNALHMLDLKYKALLDNHKQSSQKAIQSQYIVNLKRLEDKLIRAGDLGGALVVQTERKNAMQNSESTISGISEKKGTVKKTRKAQPKIKRTVLPKKTSPAAKKIRLPPASSPHVYSSTKKGFAGSGKSSAGNRYSFTINPTKKGAELFFHAYGRKSNDSYGEVYLSTPGGGKYQVAHWSPEQLKQSSFRDVKTAQDIVPITTNISKYVKKEGKYTVEFLYRDGNEALIIYQVGVKTK